MIVVFVVAYIVDYTLIIWKQSSVYFKCLRKSEFVENILIMFVHGHVSYVTQARFDRRHFVLPIQKQICAIRDT